MARLKREALGVPLEGVVLDLRGNPGGYYHEGVAVSDTFLEEGTIVSTVDRLGREVDHKEARNTGTEGRYPLAVLLDAGSASASEIVAGALRNNDRAVVIGERSFGKGSVQNLQEFYDGSKLKLTVSRYLTPGERSIQAVGISPDIELRRIVLDPDPFDEDALGLFAFRHARLQREADLPGALDAQIVIGEQPVWTVPYLRGPEEWIENPQSGLVDDIEVDFAREVLLAAHQWRRPDVLSTASSVIERFRRSHQTLIRTETVSYTHLTLPTICSV